MRLLHPEEGQRPVSKDGRQTPKFAPIYPPSRAKSFETAVTRSLRKKLKGLVLLPKGNVVTPAKR